MKSIVSALSRAVTAYTGSVATPLQLRKTVERRLNRRIGSLGFHRQRAHVPHLPMPEQHVQVRRYESQCQSLCAFQQKYSFNTIEGMRTLLYFFLLQKKENPDKVGLLGAVWGFLYYLDLVTR